MTQQNILEMARQGNTEAIAALLNRTLEPKGVSTKVGKKEDCLYISLIAGQVPDQPLFVSFIQNVLVRLGVRSVRTVQIYGRQTGQDSPAWQQVVELAFIAPPVRQSNAPMSVISEPGQATAAAPISQPVNPVAPPVERPAIAADNGNLPPTTLQRAVPPAPPMPTIVPSPSPHTGGETQANSIVVGTHIHPEVYYVLQPNAQLGDRIDCFPIANQPQAQIRSLPIFLLPAPFPNLVNRAAESGEAIAALQTNQPTEFYGQSGVGKTSLLHCLCHHLQVIPSFPDGIVYFSARKQPLADLLQRLFDTFYESGSPLKPTEPQIQQALQGKRALVVLDDHRLDRGEVEELANHLPDCTLLLASLDRQLWNRGKSIELQGLPLEHTLSLIERELKRSLTSPERTAAEDLHLALNGHPLFIVQAVALVRDHKASLEQVVHRLEPAVPDRSLIRLILALLPKPQRSLLALLAALGGVGLSADRVSAIAEVSGVEPLLKTLQYQYLLELNGSRYSLNDALVEVIEQERDLSPWLRDLSPWMEKALTHYLTWAEQHRLQPQQLLEESDAILHLLEWSFDVGRWVEVLRLGQIIGSALALGKRWGDWERLLQWQLQAARSLNNLAAEALVLHQLGTRALCLDDSTAANNYLSEALQLRESLSDQDGVAITQHNLGLLTVAPTPAQLALQPVAQPLLPPSPAPSHPSIALWFKVVGLLLLSGIIGLILGNLLHPFFVKDNRQNPNPSPSPSASPSPSPSNSPASARLSFSPSSLNFGRHVSGSPTILQNLALTNKSAAPIVLKNIALAGKSQNDFSWVPGGCAEGVTLNPGKSCPIRVSFKPGQIAFYQAELAIQTSAESVRIPMIGAVTQQLEPSLQVSISALRFGDRPANTRSDPAKIILTSNGSASLKISNIQLADDQGDFIIAQNRCPANGILAPNKSCEVLVRFTPVDVGDRRTDLTISDNAADSPQHVTLSGRATEPTSAIRLSLDKLNFGEVQVGAESQPKTITLTNPGSAPLYVDRINLSTGRPEFPIESNCLESIISPGGKCRIRVSFLPKETGIRQTRLTVISDATVMPQPLVLRGVGTPPTNVSPPLISNLFAEPNPIIYDARNARLIVEATVTDPSGIDSVSLRYRFKTASTTGPFRIKPMQFNGNNRYIINLDIYRDRAAYEPLGGATGVLEYEIEAIDGTGNTGNNSTRSIGARSQSIQPSPNQ